MLSASLLLAAAAGVTAASGNASGNPAREAATDAASLDVITVEASKRPIAVGDIASRVTVIDDVRIERELAQSIHDLVRYEPGVDVVDQGSRFGYAGFNIRGVGGNRVHVEVDGVATSDAFSIGSFSNASRDFVDVDSIKQLEIIRGPGSAMFGSDALGGVVSYVTKSPSDYLGSDTRYFDVRAGFNSVDESATAGATAATSFGDGAAMIRVMSRDGQERDVGNADPLDDQSLNILAKLEFGAPGAGGVMLALERFDADSTTQVDSLERVQDFSDDFGFPYLIDTREVVGNDERLRTRVSVGQEWMSGKFGTDYLRWRAYWQDSETRQDTFEARESLIAGQASAVERDRTFRFEQALAGVELNAANLFETGAFAHELAWGFEYEAADTSQVRDGVELDLATGETSNTVGPDEFPLRDFPKSETQSLGIYVQDRITIGALSIIPGLRWDRYELEPQPDPIFAADNPGIEPVSLNDDQLSPKLGLILDVGDAWQIYAQYAEGFRAPPVNDVNVGFTNFQFGYTALPNPDLESESSAGYELGLRYLGERTAIEIAGFSTRYDDFIQSFQVVGFDPVRQLLLFQSVNVDQVQIDGAELAASFAPASFPDGLAINVSAAYAEGENRQTGAPINSVAPLNGVLGIDYRPADANWGAGLIARGATSQDDLDESGGELLRPDGYVVFDAIGHWQPAPNLTLRAGVYNLADREYTAYLDVQGVPADVADPSRYQRPGRNVSIAIDWSF